MIELFYADTPNVFKVSIALEEMGLEYKRTPISLPDKQQFQPHFMAVNPNSKIPAIIDHDPPGGGAPVSVFESGAILLYLGEKSGRFLPKDLRPRYEVVTWLMWQMAGFGPNLGQANHFLTMAPADLPYAKERFAKEAARLYGVLDRRLEGRDFICGAYSIADMACWPWLLYRELHGQRLEDHPNVARWFKAIEPRPAVKKALDGAFIPTREQMLSRSWSRPADQSSGKPT